jgi:hypothetical protein
MALLVMDYAIKEDQVWRECHKYMALWMQTRMEICIIEYLHSIMCLSYLEEQSVG